MSSPVLLPHGLWTPPQNRPTLPINRGHGQYWILIEFFQLDWPLLVMTNYIWIILGFFDWLVIQWLESIFVPFALLSWAKRRDSRSHNSILVLPSRLFWWSILTFVSLALPKPGLSLLQMGMKPSRGVVLHLARLD